MARLFCMLQTLVFCCLCLSSVLAASPVPHLDTLAPAEIVRFGISPDGRYLAFNQQFPPPKGQDSPIYHLHIFDLQTLTLRTLATNASGYTRIRFSSPDQLAYLTPWEGVILMDTTGKELRRFPDGSYHAFCNGTRFMEDSTGVSLLTPEHTVLKSIPGKGAFIDAVCSPDRLLLVFKQEVHLLDARSLEPVCTIPALHGSINSYTEGALLGGERVALLDHWSGVKLFDTCKLTRALPVSTMVMAKNDQLLLGHAGVIRVGRNQGPHSRETGVRHYDLQGQHVSDTPLPESLWQMELFPGRPDILVVLAKEGLFRFLNLKTGKSLTLTIHRQSGHWLLQDENGTYNSSPDSARYLYATEGTRMLPAAHPAASRNIFRHFMDMQP